MLSQMDLVAVLADFDEQMRRHPSQSLGAQVELGAKVTRVVAERGGWSGVIWSELGDDDVEEALASEIGRFAGQALPWEWKYYSHDGPPDLPVRLQAAGFVAGTVESVLVAEVDQLDLGLAPPPGVELAPVANRAGVEALVQVHDEVFGGDHARIGEVVLAGIASTPPSIAAVVAVAAGRPISAGRVEFLEGSDFATIWGGGTVPSWRGRGVFRSLVAYRAAVAKRRGYRYLQVDASPESRPILLSLGFVELTKTIPFHYSVRGYVAAG